MDYESFKEKFVEDLKDRLRCLEEEEYQIKRGQNPAIKRKDQKRFIRFKSLGEGYRPDDLPVTLKPQYDGAMKLIDLIEKPLWTYTGKRARDTLIPDLASLTVDQFVIFDAKYYNAQLEIDVEPKRQPGIESVTKQ